MLLKMKESLQKNWKRAILEFIFILAFIQVFQAVFGPENSIVGVIFTIMMSASMVKDMTATPVKHLILQAVTLAIMAASACFANVLPPAVGTMIHFATIFLIVYTYTYEYSQNMYFPYILSYLFLVYISPVPPGQLPKRLLGMLTGAVCIILYQLFKGRKRVAETAVEVLGRMIGEALTLTQRLQAGEAPYTDLEEVRHNLCRLSRTVYERRKKVLQVSDASFAMVDCGRGIEHLIILMNGLKGSMTPERTGLLTLVAEQLVGYREFVLGRTERLSVPDKESFARCGVPEADEFCDSLGYVRDHLLQMADPERRVHYHETAFSLSMRLRAALDVSAVRVIYALRVALLLAAFSLVVRLLALPHGKWLMFTLASVSLPFADDVGAKAKKRVMATIVGGLTAMVLFALVPGAGGRSFIMMASGFVNFFFSDYVGTYSCSTIGALGGAVLMDAFGWSAVGGVFAVRLGYICTGALIALLVNCVIFPFRRGTAARLLLEKYNITTALLAGICSTDNPSQVDPQMYYDLVIQCHLQEDQLAHHAADGGFEAKLKPVLAQGRERVRKAHRIHRQGYTPVF